MKTKDEWTKGILGQSNTHLLSTGHIDQAQTDCDNSLAFCVRCKHFAHRQNSSGAHNLELNSIPVV